MSEYRRDAAVVRLVRFAGGQQNQFTPEDARAIMEEIGELGQALEQALRYVEADELAHGRRFGTGNAIRAALRREPKTGELLIGEE